MKGRLISIALALGVLGGSAAAQVQLLEPSQFGNITVAGAQYTNSFGSYVLPSGINGGTTTNVPNGSDTCSFARKGNIANGNISELAPGGGPGGQGWPTLNSPVGINNSYTCDTGTNLQAIVQNFQNVDVQAIMMMLNQYNSNTLAGEYTLQCIETSGTGAKTLKWHIDFVITSDSSVLQNNVPPSGGVDPTTQNNTGNTATNTAATNSKLDTLNTAVGGLDTDVKAGTTATVNAVNGQNVNQGSWWANLVVPQDATVTNLKAAIAQLFSWGPLGLLSALQSQLAAYQAGGSQQQLQDDYLFLGFVPMFGNMTLDLTPFSSALHFARALGAGYLWWLWCLGLWKRISKTELV